MTAAYYGVGCGLGSLLGGALLQVVVVLLLLGSHSALCPAMRGWRCSTTTLSLGYILCCMCTLPMQRAITCLSPR
jgi:hypothetical protein